MNALRRMFASLGHMVRANLDMLVLWLALAAAQSMVPLGHFLARNDLVPWTILSLSLAAAWRGRDIGDGPHPALTRRQDRLGRIARRIALLATPWLVLLWFEGCRLGSLLWYGGAAGALLVVVVAAILARRDGRTAWRPPGSSELRAWLVGLILLSLAVGAIGWWSSPGFARLLPALAAPAWLGPAVMVGVGFLGSSLVCSRALHAAQRRAAGRSDGARYRRSLFAFALSLGGPAVGLAVLLVFLGQHTDFSMAYAPTLHVVFWAAVIWPRREPVARACLLHEVIPSSGADRATGQKALSFEEAPEGALRLNPLKTRRIRVVHPWLVPVHGPRIAALDDPVRGLWPGGRPPIPFHVLGEASFEPDPLTRKAQWDVITVHLSSRMDVASVEGTGAQSRRIAILRAFPSPGFRRRRVLATYRWQSAIPSASLQLLDATVETATLQDGDLLVLSSEGVSRAFEVELGALVYDSVEARSFRPPQLEDYVEVG
ncbi:MAG: hypothetical protein ABIO70_20895 [Pseudomonadota bacterium]